MAYLIPIFYTGKARTRCTTFDACASGDRIYGHFTDAGIPGLEISGRTDGE